ncbi:Secretin ExeD [Phycisphaerales bacterium]|nr:Secretin ExeD [Phycisphaerales bacterium]
MHAPFQLRRAAVCSALWLAAACPSLAQDVRQPGQNAPQTPLTLASQLDLPRLLDLCADRLHLRIDYDPAAVKGQVTLRLPDSLSDAELWDLTNQLLAQRGFTTVRAAGGQTVSVVKSTDAAALARIETPAAKPDNAPAAPPDAARAGFASLVVAPRYRSVKDAADAIRPLLTKGVGSATALGESRLLLISDFTPRLGEIQSLLERIDAPSGMIVEELAAKNVPAATLVATLMQVAQKRDALSGDKLPGEVIVSPAGGGVVLITPEPQAAAWREMIARFDQREGVETRNYVPRVFAAKDVGKLVEETMKFSGAGGAASKDERWRVIIDELTGTLVVTATPSQHAQIVELMTRLDAAGGGPMPMRSYPIRNRPVSEMIETLSRLIEAGVLDAGGDISREGIRAAGAQRTTRDLTTGVVSPAGVLLGTDAPGVTNATSSAFAGTPQSAQGAARPVGASHDDHTPLRLTADESTNTLIAVGEPRLLSQLESLLQLLDVRQPQVMLEVVLVSVTDSDAVNLGIELEKLGNIGDAAYKVASLFGLSTGAAGARTVADAAGFTGAVLSPGEFNIVVRALEAINKGRSLSNPKVLVANNEQARFSSVLQQPFVRTDTTSNTATSSFGGSDSAGTTISVKPQIAQGDHLVLTYNISLSSFVGTPAAAGLPPPKQQNTVDSVATIPDGHTVVIGGLELQSDSKSTSQIPVLGDVPLLGELFKNRSKGSNHTKFYAFIKATVLRSGSLEDLRYVSRIDGAAMGVNDGFPEVRPRVIR